MSVPSRGIAPSPGKARVAWVVWVARVPEAARVRQARITEGAAPSEFLDQQLGNLHGVECGAFEKLIAADEQVDPPPVFARAILPDAAHQNVVQT